MTDNKELGSIHGSDSNENWDNFDLFHHHLFHDFRNRNHIAMERLVPELLGEFDNSWEPQQQLSYVLACLRRLARDLNILNHEFDSVIDGLLQVINQILNEFSKEITDEINLIWNEINNLFDRDINVKTDETLTFVKTGNWHNKEEALNFNGKIHYSTITKEVPIAGMKTKTVGNASSNISGNFTPDLSGYIAELQVEINNIINKLPHGDISFSAKEPIWEGDGLSGKASKKFTSGTYEVAWGGDALGFVTEIRIVAQSGATGITYQTIKDTNRISTYECDIKLSSDLQTFNATISAIDVSDNGNSVSMSVRTPSNSSIREINKISNYKFDFGN